MALVELILTFLYLRVVSWAAFIAMSWEWRRRARFVHVVTVNAFPPMLAAAAIVIVTGGISMTGLSPAGAWLSLAVDAAWIAGAIRYTRRIARLRDDPASTRAVVWVYSIETTTDLGRWFPLERSRILAKAVEPYFFVPQADFAAVLASDVKAIDIFGGDDEYRPENGDFDIAPHVGLTLPESFRNAGWPTTYAFQVIRYRQMMRHTPNAVASRQLVHRASERQWLTSRRLCATPPRAIACAWKSFYFQPGFRLHFVCLFNTAEMLVRLAGAIALSILRSSGVLIGTPLFRDGGMLRKGSFGQWVETIETAVAVETPLIAACRETFLDENPALATRDTLEPLWELLGFRPRERPPHLLGALRRIGELRNALLGHGAVGNRLELDPLPYVAALHEYFLDAVAPLVDWDLAVRAWRPAPEGSALPLEEVGRDAGLLIEGELADDCVPICRIPGRPDRVVSLHPYLRFAKGRLLFLRRILREESQFYDFETADPNEATVLSFPLHADAYATPGDAFSPGREATTELRNWVPPSVNAP